jgi:hypothetical protein
VDITTMVDTITNVICGKTATLSPFVAAGTKSPTGIGDPGGSMPSAFALLQNVPNPFNPTTTIGFEVPTGGARVTIRIYDVAGRLVRTVVNEYRAAGRHRVPWDGRNQHGARVATGVYFYRMEAGSFAQTRKMLLLK